MSSVLYLVNRYVAPFASGLCMAAATAVDSSMTAAGLIAFAGIFAFFSLEAGSRMMPRLTGMAA